MAQQDGKWITINGRHVFIPKGKKLEDVWDYQTDKRKEDNYEEDLSDYEDEDYEKDIDKLGMSGMTEEEKEIYKAHKDEIDGDGKAHEGYKTTLEYTEFDLDDYLNGKISSEEWEKAKRHNTKLSEKEAAIDEIRKITDRIDSYDADSLEGYMSEDEAARIKELAQKHHLTGDDLRKISNRTFQDYYGYGTKNFEWKEEKKDEWRLKPENLKAIQSLKDNFGYTDEHIARLSEEDLEVFKDFISRFNKIKVK